MWIMANDGFLSIVAHKHRPDYLLVRARVKGDIESIFGDSVYVFTDKYADYYYRAEIERDVVAKKLSQQLMRIDYTNFKDSVCDKSRHDYYMNVWGTLNEFGEFKRQQKKLLKKEQEDHNKANLTLEEFSKTIECQTIRIETCEKLGKRIEKEIWNLFVKNFQNADQVYSFNYYDAKDIYFRQKHFREGTPNNIRKFLLMIQALHKLGYEKLRFSAHLSPSGGCLRHFVVPKRFIRRKNGIEFTEGYLHKMEELTEEQIPDGSNCDPELGMILRWDDAYHLSVDELAERFLNEFPNTAKLGKGKDPKYVNWFNDMIEKTSPIGIVFLSGDYEWSHDRLEVAYIKNNLTCKDLDIAFPPY